MARFIESTKEINKAARKQRKPKQQKPKPQKPKQQKPKQNTSANKPVSNKPTVTKTGGGKNKAGGSQYSVKQDRQITSRQTQAPKNNSVNRNTRENTNRATQRYSTNVRNGSQYSVANSANRRATRNYKQQQNNRFERRKNELKDSNILKGTKTATNNDIRRMGGAQYKVDNSSRKEFAKRVSNLTEGSVKQVVGGHLTSISHQNDRTGYDLEMERITDLYKKGRIDKTAYEAEMKSLQEREKQGKKKSEVYESKARAIQNAGDKQVQEGMKGLSGISKVGAEAYNSLIGMGMDMTLGPASLVGMASRTYGNSLNSLNKLVKKGIISAEEAERYAAMQSAKEVGTELLFKGAGAAAGYAGAGKATEKLSLMAKRGIDKATQRINNNVLKNVVSTGLKLGQGAAEEATEEAIAGLLDAPITNIAYANRLDKEYRGNLEESGTSINSQRDQMMKYGYTRDEATAIFVDEIGSDDYLNELAQQYIDDGMSEKRAFKQAKNMQEYMIASLNGDEKTMQSLEDKMTEGIKAKFSLSDTLEAMAAAGLMTAVTGGLGSVNTMAKGEMYKNIYAKANGTENAAEAITKIAKGLSDKEMAARATAMYEHASQGKELSYEQYVELGQAIEKQAVENSSKAQSAIKVARNQAESEGFYVSATPQKVGGRYAFGHNAVETQFGSVIVPEGPTQQRAEEVRKTAYAVTNQIEAELGIALDDKDALVEEITAAECGFASGDIVEYLTDAFPENRAVYEAITGVKLPADNAKMRDAVFTRAIEKNVEMAKAETIERIDLDTGNLDVQYANDFGGEGQQLFHALTNNISTRDKETSIRYRTAFREIYDAGRTGASLDAAMEYARDVHNLDKADVIEIFNAGIKDKDNKDIPTVTYNVSDPSKIKNSEREVFLAFSRAFGVNIVITDDFTVSDGQKVGGQESVEESNTQVNGMHYDNTIYLNLNDDIHKSIGYTIMHELTHNIEQRFPTEYKAFADLFKQRWIEKNGQESFDKAIKDRISAYDNAGAKLTEEDALSEIIADQMAEVLYDEEFISNIAEEHPSIARAILDSIRDIIRKIRQLFANYGGFRSEFNEATLSQLDMLKDAEALLVKAIQAAQDGRTQEILDGAKKFSIDSEGNEISPQQSEYFKDSKVRDEEGNLLVMYHGTNADFTVFDKNYIGGTGRFEGAGFNFTSFEGRAMSYDTSGEGKVFRTYLNIKNPLSDSERTITKSKLKKIVSGIAQREDIEGYDSIIFAVTAPYGKNIDEDYNRSLADTVDYLWRSCKTDADIYSQISTLGTNDEVVIDEFEKEGFDGLIWHDDGTISTVIAFEPEQIKSVDNKQPTLNPDIRFSIQQSEYIAENMNVGIQFSLPTFHNEMPKFEKWTKTKGFTGIGEVISGKELLIRTMVKNKIDEDVAKRIVGFLATVANGITSDVMHATYAYINWENLENSEVSVRIDRDGNITSIVGSAMVANGEYPVNFDFTTICNKREGMMEIIKKLALTQTESGTSYLDEIKLTRENIWKMNLALKEHNVDTACLGCFVEARRYNTDSFLSKIDEKWNSAVREKRKELGLPEEEYFDFSTNAKPSNEDVSQAIELWEGYDSNKTRGAKSSPAARINTLLKNATADSPYLKLIHPSDMLTPAGIEGLSHISVEGHSLVKTMKSIYGTAAPKEILAFTPYNSEIALLPEKVGNKDIIEYLKEIGGVRVQSFSDFKIENVFDYMQMVADMAARKFPAHAYTKVIEFAEIFGLTGIKINLSVMFDVHSSNEWAEMLGCDSKRAKEIAKKYAGLTFVEKIPEDDKKRLKDEKQTRPYKFVTDFEGTGKDGYLTYLVGDKDRAEKAYQAAKDAIMSGQKYRDGLLTDDEVEMMARSAMPFDQSINYNEAAEKQDQEGYKEHIGIIAVGYSDEHIRMLLDDNNVRYIIPYHKSGLPTEISKVSNLGNARSYEDLQNTIRVKDGKIYDNEGNAKNLKSHYKSFAKEHKSNTPAIDYITSMINSGEYTIITKEKKLDENGEVKETKADVKLHGTGTFDVYKSLAKHSKEGLLGVQAVAEEYCDHCLRNGCLPIFYQFVDNPSYFKFLFDYAVTDADGNIHMQGAVKNAYPGINADEVAQNREIEESDLKELYASVRKGMAMQNEKNRNFAENKDSIIQGLTTKGTAHSIVEGTNLAPIINGTPDYLHPKYAPEISLETEKSDDTSYSLPGAKFSIVEGSDGEYNVDELETSLKERFKEYETDEENLKLATEAVADIGKIRLSIDGDTDDVRRNTSGIRTIAKGISEQFINEGYVDFRGRKVNGPEDVAAMMQVCRDPRFETFRIILVKGNKVVSVRNMSSRLPGMSAAFEYTDAQESFELMKDRMRRSQADGYYLVHNHPSGQVKASSDDKMVTAMYINKVPGFKGHIILDHNKYGLIENIPEYDKESGYTLPKASEVETGGQLTIDFMNIPEVEHRMLGKSTGNKADSVANTIKQLQTSKSASIVLYADSQLKVREIQEIDNVVIENQKHLKSYIFNEGVRCGARHIFVGSYKFETYSVLREMVKDGVLTDAFMLFDSIDARSARVDDSAVPLVNEDAIAKNRGFVLYDGTKDYENNSLAEVIPSKESVIQYSIDNPWDTSWFDGILDDEEVNTRGDRNKSISEISAEFTNIVRDNAKLTGGKVLDRKSIKKQIGELVKMTTKDTTYTAKEKREIADFLVDTAEQIWSITGEKRPIKLKQEEIDRIISLLYDASDYVISNAQYLNDSMLNEIIEFKKFFRGREVGVSAGARAELADDWDTIRKRNFGRVRFVSAEKYGVTNIADALIQTFPEAPEISLLYGREVEEALEIGDEATLVRILDDVLSNLSVVDDAIKSEYAEDFRVALSQDFARIVLNEGEAWESKMDRFKDRYEQRIKDLRARQKEAVRDLRSNYEKLLAEQNATFKKKLAETKAKSEARLQAEKDKQKAKEQKRKDSEQRKKIRNRIAEDYNWLAQRLVKPKKDDFKHIPSDFIESVANLLEIFDFQTERSLKLEEKRGHASGATKAMRELKDKISKYSSPDGGNVFVRNDALDILVDECIELLDGRALRELEDNELQKVSEMLRAVRHMVKTQNELFVANRKATVAEAGESIISESAKKIEKYGRRYDRTGISGRLSQLLNEDMMTPGNFFDSLGGTMKALYKNLRNAQDDYIMKVKFLRDFYKNLLGGYYKKAKPGSAVEDWQTQTNEFTLSDGSKLNITVAQAMSLYCLSKREQALGHILGSGIVLSDVTLDKGIAKVIGGKIQNTASGYRMTYNDIMNVISSLTDEQRRIADAIQNLMNTTLKEWGNETSLRLFDMEFFTEENYFPISVEQSELATEIGKGTEIKGNRITSFGMTKPLTEHANNKIIIGDIFSIAADHCNKMALYSAYAPSLIDFNRVYNYKQRNEDGTTGYTVKGILKDAYSNKALKFIDNILDDINGQAQPRTDGLTAMINTSLANYKKAAIGLNIRVLVQQPTAIMRSLYMINPKYFTPDCFVGLKSAREEMHKYCPISAWKAWGNYQNDYTKNFEDVMLNKDWSKFDAVTMGAYGWADDMTWAVIWNAVKNEVKQKNPNVEVGSEEYWDLCNERASEIFDETQVVDSVFHRSDAMRNPDKLSKVATSFMAEPTRTYNMVRSSIVKAYRSHKDGDNKAAAAELNKMLVVVTLNAAAVSAAAAVVDAFRGKGDDDDDETWLETFYRNFGENFKDNVNMLHNIVYVKDVVSLFENAIEGKYFSPSNMVFDGWAKLAKGVGEYKKVLSGDKTFIEWISGDFGAGIGYVTGIPTATFIKDTKALWKRLNLPTFATDGVEEETPSLWDYENNPLEVTDGTWADNVLNFFGINLTPEERAERDFKRTLKEVESKTKDLSGAEKKEAVNKIVMEGYTSLVEDGDFAKLKQMRRIIEAAGGDVEAFDEKVTKRTASEYKKTIGVEADMAKQAEMRQYLLENGWTEAKISGEIVYKSNLAKDFKKACRELDIEKGTDVLTYLILAGITEADAYKLWENRNRGNFDTYSTGKYIAPTNGQITSGFGYRSSPTAGASSYHQGIDIAASRGSVVSAADGGRVVYAGYNGGYGNQIVIQHDDGTQTYYSHLDHISVRKGQSVSQKQYIGNVGSTGISTGPHLDFRVNVGGQFVDPLKYFSV